METPETIIFIKPTDSSFIRIDQKILEKHYRVIPYLLHQNKGKLPYFKNLLLLSFYLLFNYRKFRAFVCWFGDYHAAVMVFLAKLTGRTSIIFAGGQEAVLYRELGKGVYLKKTRAAFVKYALRNCSLILPNHQSLVYHANFFYNSLNPHIDGIRHYVKNVKAKIQVVPNGIDVSRIKHDPSVKKEADLVLTVGTMNKMADFYNKGYDLFIELARRCSNYRFVAIGIKPSYLEKIEEKYNFSGLKNLKIIPGFCPPEILNEYYNKAKVYLQVSITEGMPNSLGEAMLCECIPVGSNVNGIPDAIGETGVIIYKRDINELKEGLNRAMSMETGALARKHTLENFSVEKREKRLMEILTGYIK